MEKLKQAVSEEDFQCIKKEILKMLKGRMISAARNIAHSWMPRINYTPS